MDAIAQAFVRRRGLRRLLWVAALLVGGWIVSSFAVGFLLSRRLGGPHVENRPSPSNMTVGEVRLTTADGEHLGAWLFNAEAPGPSIVLLHGWRGSRTTLITRAEALASRGFTVFALSLRAHGDSSGSEYDFGLDNRQDVIAAVQELEHLRPGHRIAVVGFSYGAAAAAFAAEELGGRVSAYVLDSMCADVRSAIRARCELFLPVVLDDLAWWGLVMASHALMPRLDEMDNVRACGGIPKQVPVLLARGNLDKRVPLADTERLRAALDGHVESIEWAGADHDRGFEQDRQRWLATVDAFLRKAPQ